LEELSAHDERDALGFTQGFAVEIAGVVELEGDALGVFSIIRWAMKVSECGDFPRSTPRGATDLWTKFW
jgi:hypothetical protein